MLSCGTRAGAWRRHCWLLTVTWMAGAVRAARTLNESGTFPSDVRPGQGLVPDLQNRAAGIHEELQFSGDAATLFTAVGKSFVMILATEFGDETFIIAAIMAMRHSRLVVYAGAMGALVTMTVISTALGFVLPSLISQKATHHAASVLYTVFGVRLLWIAWRSKPQDTNQEEVDEAEAKVAKVEHSRSGVQRFLAQFLAPVFLEAFILTFLAEWGDRSQIATISLAGQYNPYGVTLGAVVGHALCTGTAVLGGQLLAMRISQRTVALCGGLLFLAFAASSIWSSAAAS